MNTICLPEKHQSLVMETLTKIHGQGFVLKSQSSYKNKDRHIPNTKAQTQSMLRIKETIDYSNVKPETQEGQLRKFAAQKLESYGFHANHCAEALDYFKDDIEESFLNLYMKYVQYDPSNLCDEFKNFEEILIERNEEKSVLGSIFESDFQEKVPNQLWIIDLELDYLLEYHNLKMEKTSNENQKSEQNGPEFKKSKDKRKLELCKNLLKGYCKFGPNCWYSHQIEGDSKQKLNNEQDPAKSTKFSLEIHFKEWSKYPYQVPIILLKHDMNVMKKTCLLLCYKLVQEAESCMKIGQPCVFHLVDFLKSSDIVLDFIKGTQYRLPDENRLLFSISDDAADDFNESINLASHFEKSCKLFSLPEISDTERRAIDKNLIDNFKRSNIRPNFNLPACKMTNEILEKVHNNQVLLIHGDTGCGKSTQVPQIILNDWMLNYSNKSVNIICTQPRRLATLAVAERVAFERCDRIGNLVGYQIRLEKSMSSKTRLLFCTNGILLRRLINDPLVHDVTHLIIDEVHERSEETDFLLLILKILLKKRNDLKIILMSATFNQEKFTNYFEKIASIEIPGRTFPVTQVFLEEFLEKSGYVLEQDTIYAKKFDKNRQLQRDLTLLDAMAIENADGYARIPDEKLSLFQLKSRYSNLSNLTVKNLYLMDEFKVNLDLIEFMIDYILSGVNHSYPDHGTILVFLPGIGEIRQLYDLLKSRYSYSSENRNVIILPLHSSLSNDEQNKIFMKTKLRKVILSTNIAETSITIDDCVFVIDCGKMKEKQYDSDKNMESLKTVWISRANANQRNGRAGRVMPGVCFRLFTRYRFEHHFKHYPIAEILRIPLEPLILKIKTMSLFYDKDIFKLFGAFIEEPSRQDIETSLKRLENIGALTKEKNLTALGTHLSILPVDVRVGKLMIFGAMFRCVDAVLTVAAILSYKSPFHIPFNKQDALFTHKKKFHTCSSDQLTALSAYNKWLNEYKKNRHSGKEFASLNFLSHSVLLMIMDLKQQFLELLVDINFVPINLPKQRASIDNILEVTGPEWNTNGSNSKLLTALLCAALYPNVAKIQLPTVKYKKTSSGAVPLPIDFKELPLRTKDCHSVFLHKSSVNYLVQSFFSEFLLFQEKFETNKIYLFDTTVISALSVVLFSSDPILIEVHNNNTVILLNNRWILIDSANHKTAEMVVALRKELMKILEMKIKDPLLNLLNHETGKVIIQTVVKIITNE